MNENSRTFAHWSRATDDESEDQEDDVTCDVATGKCPIPSMTRLQGIMVVVFIKSCAWLSDNEYNYRDGFSKKRKPVTGELSVGTFQEKFLKTRQLKIVISGAVKHLLMPYRAQCPAKYPTNLTTGRSGKVIICLASTLWTMRQVKSTRNSPASIV